MINRGYKDPWRHPHKLAGCHSELSGVVTPQGHSLKKCYCIAFHTFSNLNRFFEISNHLGFFEEFIAQKSSLSGFLLLDSSFL